MIEFARTLQEASWIYRFCRGFCRMMFQLLWRMEIHYPERVPSQGPLIVCANHRSFADPPVVGSALLRPVHFLAKKELFSFRPFGWLISRLNAHPLNRSGDVGAFKMALRVLKNDGVMIVFPEGGRSKIDQFRPAKPGVGLLAKKTGVPILPIYIHNSAHWLKGYPLTVVIGFPMKSSQFDNYNEVGPAVMRQIKNLKDEWLAK